jgi:hypothetical protein
MLRRTRLVTRTCRAAGEECGEVRSGIEDLLAVIEHEERLPRVEGLSQDVPKEPIAGIPDAYHFG